MLTFDIMIVRTFFVFGHNMDLHHTPSLPTLTQGNKDEHCYSFKAIIRTFCMSIKTFFGIITTLSLDDFLACLDQGPEY